MKGKLLSPVPEIKCPCFIIYNKPQHFFTVFVTLVIFSTRGEQLSKVSVNALKFHLQDNQWSIMIYKWQWGVWKCFTVHWQTLLNGSGNVHSIIKTPSFSVNCPGCTNEQTILKMWKVQFSLISKLRNGCDNLDFPLVMSSSQ